MEAGFVPLMIMLTLWIASKVTPKLKANKEVRKIFRLDDIEKEGDVQFRGMSPYRESMKMTFRAYMSSDMWQRVRERVIYLYEGQCAYCYEDGYVVHHTNYRNWGKGNQSEVDDCMYLCSSCHDDVHMGLDQHVVPFFAKRKEHGYVSDTDMGQVSDRPKAFIRRKL
jgi:5-methylcytosine-specific restriction endonuclease McrA